MTTTKDLSEYGIESLATEGEWKIGTNITDLSAVVQFVYGKLAERAARQVHSYWSDLYHDARWMAEHVTGVEPVSFWFAYDDMGTHIGTDPVICKFRNTAMRVTVRLERNRYKDMDAYLKFETVHRPMGWRK